MGYGPVLLEMGFPRHYNCQRGLCSSTAQKTLVGYFLLGNLISRLLQKPRVSQDGSANWCSSIGTFIVASLRRWEWTSIAASLQLFVVAAASFAQAWTTITATTTAVVMDFFTIDCVHVNANAIVIEYVSVFAQFRHHTCVVISGHVSIEQIDHVHSCLWVLCCRCLLGTKVSSRFQMGMCFCEELVMLYAFGVHEAACIALCLCFRRNHIDYGFINGDVFQAALIGAIVEVASLSSYTIGVVSLGEEREDLTAWRVAARASYGNFCIAPFLVDG